MSAAVSSNPGSAPAGSDPPSDPQAAMPSTTTTMASSGPADSSPQPFHSASLYVGDLAPDVDEGLLFDIFNAVGPVSSIRVCRDAVTRRSLGYAYVNFHQLVDAERALDTMNYTMIKGRPCRLMWCQRDPSLRRSGVGNIFVKNLHISIDNKQLYDTFSLFGNILSCKVVTDGQSGKSKGYGYVHYETAEAANAAIDKLDGMLIDGQEVQVGHFMRRSDRPGQNEWTNCYVKSIPLEWDDARLREEFSKFGEVISCTINKGMRKKIVKTPAAPSTEDKPEAEAESKPEAEGDTEPAAEGEAEKKTDDTEPKEAPKETTKEVEEYMSLGFGFVNYEEHEAAVAAVEVLNGKVFKSTFNGEEKDVEMYVGRAQKKAERERDLKAKYEAEKMDRISKFQGVNLYVKNLDDSITDDVLREEFATMGTITSARIMKDMKDGRSRGFGFVCFSSPDEANRAVSEMNGKLIANKPIFVALAQRRDVRRAQLEAQHATRGVPSGPGAPGMMRGPMGAPMGYPGAMPMYMQRPGPGGAMQPAYPMMQQMMGGPGGRGGGGQRPGGMYMMQQGRGGYPMPYGVMGQQPGRGGRGPVPGRGRGGRGPGPTGPMQGGGQQPIKFNQQARNAGGGPPNAPGQAPTPQQAAPPQQQVMLPQDAVLTASALASASPEMQKNMIGERLYPLIHQSQPELAGKITGMLLEMDNSELLHLLESPEALNSKISEALQVLDAHKATTSG